MSQFAAVVADIRVLTGLERKCSGKWGSGKSEVIQVKAWNTEGWGCQATVVAGGDVRTGIFSRNNVKECGLDGTAFGYTLSMVAP